MEALVAGPHGVRKAYAYTGGKPFAAGRPTVVFVHGALHDHSVWTLLARWFAHHGHAVLAPDLPGHARSEGPALDSVEALADWLLALADAAGAGELALVGHSMGSLIALEAAARAPQRVTHLAMLATAYPMAVSPALLATAAETPLAAIEKVNAYSHSGMAAKPAFPGPGTWTHGANLAFMRRVLASADTGNLFLQDFEICNRYARGLEAAAAVACPVTFVLGAHDQMTPPRQASELAKALDARIETILAGHALMTEAPDAVLAALRRAIGAARVHATAGAQGQHPA
jgi:pimeloyl-ACP methyl ester carboxylesterase